MQPELQYFLTLLIAHVLADFPFQTNAMVTGKTEGQAGAYLRHLAVHLLITTIAIALLLGLEALRPRTLLALGGLLVAHGLLDWGKSRLITAKPSWDGSLVFVLDQAAHVFLIALAVWVMVPGSVPGQPLIGYLFSYREAILPPVAIVLVTVFPSGYLIRYLLRPLSDQLARSQQHSQTAHEASSGDSDGEQPGDCAPSAAQIHASQVELSNAGLYLGWLERGLMTIAIAADSMGAVGIILGAKSIARFPEFKSRSFAEYFLIGTLLSVLFAFAGGLLIKLVA